MAKLILITIGAWLATVIVIVGGIVLVAGLTVDVSAAGMDIPLLGLGAWAVLTVTADTFMVALLARRLVDNDLRRVWVAGFFVWEMGTAVFLMVAALVVLNR